MIDRSASFGLIDSNLANAWGDVAICVRRDLQHDEVIRLCGEVNRLIGWLYGKAPPAVDFAHCDLTRSQPKRRTASSVSAEASTVWVLIRRLNSSCRRSMAFDVRIDFHRLFGNRAKGNSLSQACCSTVATPLPAIPDGCPQPHLTILLPPRSQRAVRLKSTSQSCIHPATGDHRYFQPGSSPAASRTQRRSAAASLIGIIRIITMLASA